MNQELLISQTDMRTVKESTTMVYSSAKEIVNQYMNISIRTHYIEAVSKHSIKIRWRKWLVHSLQRAIFLFENCHWWPQWAKIKELVIDSEDAMKVNMVKICFHQTEYSES